MADLYLALGSGWPGFEPRVVVKRIIGGHGSRIRSRLERMFITEAKLAARLCHPNIVTVHDAGEVEGEPYLVLEYIAGMNVAEVMYTLRRSCPDAHLPAALAAFIAHQLCRGLAHAHEHVYEGRRSPIIHCDISPENIMLGYDGRVKLVDFGLAQAPGLLDAELSGLAGKLAYMAPEQLRGERIDPATDLFSVGVVLHEMLTGQRLFRAATRGETRARVLSQPPSRPSAIAPAVPVALDRVVLRALDRDRKRRYRSAEQLAHDLEPLLPRAGDLALGRLMTLLYLARPTRAPVRQIESTQPVSQREVAV
jgi:eukaryotic-like serine/threonine-protein kinase